MEGKQSAACPIHITTLGQYQHPLNLGLGELHSQSILLGEETNIWLLLGTEL